MKRFAMILVLVLLVCACLPALADTELAVVTCAEGGFSTKVPTDCTAQYTEGTGLQIYTCQKNIAKKRQIVWCFKNYVVFLQAEHINSQRTMTQNLSLNQAQMDFLRLLSHFTKEEEVKELNDLVCEYYARKVDEEMDRLWDEGKWSEEEIQETLQEHLRTPYNA